MFWKAAPEPTIKNCLGGLVDVVQKFITIQNFGHNWWWANGKSSAKSAAQPQSSRVTVKIERNTRKIYYAKRFRAGQWAFLGLGSEKKWYSTLDCKPQGEWDKIAELMMLKLGESTRAVFRATSPLSWGVLKSKGGGKFSIHYCADFETIETFVAQFSTSLQLMFFLCKIITQKYVCLHHTWLEQWTRLSFHNGSLPFYRDRIHIFHTFLRLHRKDWADLQNFFFEKLSQQDWVSKFVLMQDSWQRLTSDGTSWRKSLKNSHNSQIQWLVVSTLCQETKVYLNQKVGFEGTPKLGPCWKFQLVAWLLTR